MSDDRKAHGLNRAEGRIFPGQGQRAPNIPDPVPPPPAPVRTAGPQFRHEDRMANGTAITVRTNVEVVPGERVSAGDYRPPAKRANWRDYSGR